MTREEFGDCEVHLEFLMPKAVELGHQVAGGVRNPDPRQLRQGQDTGDDCGGIYPRAELLPTYKHIDEGIAPKVNAAKAGRVADARHRLGRPRFDADGKKDGQRAVRQGDAERQGDPREPGGDQHRPATTGADKETPRGPILLQGDHGPVAFRDVRARVLLTNRDSEQPERSTG